MKQLLGRQLDIVTGIAGLSDESRNKYRELYSAKGYEIPDVEVSATSRQPRPPRSVELVGTALTKRIAWLTNIQASKTCNCKNLSQQMDLWGIAGCELNRQQIINHLVGQRELLSQSFKMESPVKAAITSIVPDMVLRFGADWLLNQAIEDTKEKLLSEPSLCSRPAVANRTAPAARQAPQTHSRPTGPPIRRVTSDSVPSADRGKRTIPSARSIERHARASATLYAAAVASAPATPMPFRSEPVFHFCAHLWPVKGHGVASPWRWHIENWNEIAESITGKCVVGVVMDPSCDSEECVRSLLSPRFEVFVDQNTKEGENPTFRKLQTMMPSGYDDVILYTHGKGVRHHTAASEAVRIWTEMMYESVMFNQDKIVDVMSRGYNTFGSFRTFGSAPLSPRYKWHYSGTFFAVRGHEIRSGLVKPGYGGVEAWPGTFCKSRESWCEFSDNSRMGLGYDISALYPEMVDKQMQWEADRLGGIRCEQHRRELLWFLKFLRPDDRVLIIGSKHGGLEHQIIQRTGIKEIVSVDVSPAEDNAVPCMIVGSSLDKIVQKIIMEKGPYSVVFIDGDHGYPGSASDWEFAKSLNPRLIAFHDIADSVKHRSEGCHVDVLWREIIAQGHKTQQKIVGCGWGGIGVVEF